jgi:hypothetical protein
LRSLPVLCLRPSPLVQEPSSQVLLLKLPMVTGSSLSDGSARSRMLWSTVPSNALVVSAAALQKKCTLWAVIPPSTHEHGDGKVEIGDGLSG